MSLVTVHGPARRMLSGDRLSDADLTAIEADLRHWSKPKITWRAVETRVEALLGRRFSRQALESHQEVYRAYVEAKKRLRAGLPLAKRKPLAERFEVLQAECRKLREENNKLLEKHLTWKLNAAYHGVGEDKLNAPLPTARQPSDVQDQKLKRREQQRAKRLADRDRRQARLTRQ